jgi:hypothetical protein
MRVNSSSKGVRRTKRVITGISDFLSQTSLKFKKKKSNHCQKHPFKKIRDGYNFFDYVQF